MEWTEKLVEQLKQLWTDGLSTAEIGRRLGITKNAVIGKAHRLGLPSRPSPIRKITKATKKTTSTTRKKQPQNIQPTPTLPLLDTRKTQPVTVVSTPTPPIAIAKPQPETTLPFTVEKTAKKAPEKVPEIIPEQISEKVSEKPLARKKKSVTSPLPLAKNKTTPKSLSESDPTRRRNAACCWPLGNPGTPGFHFCGEPPLVGKPYCEAHCQIAYVRLRPRNSRDSK
ncbi:MAG: GcrA cell cycle regulator [Acetobacter sp.]|nr:GcrA cell cycle regulator [Acetobacter sp.]